LTKQKEYLTNRNNNMKPTTLDIVINNEPRINTCCKLKDLYPLLKLEARILGVKVNTLSGLKKALRGLNRSIILN